jgi:hypothetical protein
MEQEFSLENAPQGTLLAMRGLESYVCGSGLQPSLLELF